VLSYAGHVLSHFQLKLTSGSFSTHHYPRKLPELVLPYHWVTIRKCLSGSNSQFYLTELLILTGLTELGVLVSVMVWILVSYRLKWWRLGPQLIVLFGKVIKTSGGGAQMEEVGHWGVPLKITSGPNSLLSPCLVPGCHDVKKFALPHVLAVMMFCLITSPQQKSKPTMDWNL
jgi:hypothetical protein